MPQDRVVIGASRNVLVERVRWHETAPEWSPLYRSPTRRVVLPGSGTAQLRSGDSEVLIDDLTAFGLPEAIPYQIKPEQGSNGRAGVVVSATARHWVKVPTEPQAWLLRPSALFHLRLHWLNLEAGRTLAAQTVGIVDSAFRSAVLLHSSRACVGHVSRARSLLMRERGDRVTVQDVCDAVHVSPSHLARSFRRHVGVSLHEYRQRLCLCVALDRLEAGENDLAGLAHDLGFCHQSHFGHAFRTEVGLTPAQARQAFRNAR